MAAIKSNKLCIIYIRSSLNERNIPHSCHRKNTMPINNHHNSKIWRQTIIDCFLNQKRSKLCWTLLNHSWDSNWIVNLSFHEWKGRIDKLTYFDNATIKSQFHSNFSYHSSIFILMGWRYQTFFGEFHEFSAIFNHSFSS